RPQLQLRRQCGPDPRHPLHPRPDAAPVRLDRPRRRARRRSARPLGRRTGRRLPLVRARRSVRRRRLQLQRSAGRPLVPDLSGQGGRRHHG
ncbi:hypothetical protein LTR94_037003, partial [Friedmanniomyces endolithicus]